MTSYISIQRNWGVMLMRKIRAVCHLRANDRRKEERLPGFASRAHRDREAAHSRLYVTGPIYKKVGALVGCSASVVEGVCKRYPPEFVAQVRELRQQCQEPPGRTWQILHRLARGG